MPLHVGCMVLFFELCSWVIGDGVEDLMSAWMGGAFRGRHRVARRMVLSTISWAFWTERNGRIFEGKMGASREVFEKAK